LGLLEVRYPLRFMKFPYAMLRDFVETSLDAHAIGDLLTMAGFELEGIEEVEGDFVLDIKVVSNRGDGLSVFGLAREVLAKDEGATPTALYSNAVARFPMEDERASDITERTAVAVETPDCTRYACRMFEGTTTQESPEWLQRRIRQTGMRPLGLVVDLSNYVMVELGQPLHAFDFDTLAGGRIVVRKAREGEALTTLNGVEHKLRADQLMICAGERPVGAAGIMGGGETEVTDSTKTMLLESAHFVNTSVRRTRKQMGLSTEASYRFERSVDPEGVVAALNAVCRMRRQCAKDSRCHRCLCRDGVPGDGGRPYDSGEDPPGNGRDLPGSARLFGAAWI
jgi:phenylalanyl-tRNA synthetase beta chain